MKAGLAKLKPLMVGDEMQALATVVVGTVIDPEMGDELRVTVVATGLGSEAIRAPLQVIEAAPKPASTEVELEPDYAQFDRPTAMRKYYDGADIPDVFSPSIWAGWYSGAW